MKKVKTTKIQKVFNMLNTGKKYKIQGIAKKINSPENSVRKMISVLKDQHDYDIRVVSTGTYQLFN